MKSFTYVIQDALGIHARPAGLLVKKASEFQSKVTIQKGGRSADAGRLFALMGLDVKQGDTLKVLIDGSDEETASQALEDFFRANL